VLRPGHPAARPEGLQHQVDLFDEADRRAGEGRHVTEVEHIGQRADVRRGQRVPAFRGGGLWVRPQDAGDGLLLQPFARVALGGTRAGGQLRRGQRRLGEGAVVAEAVTEVHRV
jgi:hypothetical protein